MNVHHEVLAFCPTIKDSRISKPYTWEFTLVLWGVAWLPSTQEGASQLCTVSFVRGCLEAKHLLTYVLDTCSLCVRSFQNSNLLMFKGVSGPLPQIFKVKSTWHTSLQHSIHLSWAGIPEGRLPPAQPRGVLFPDVRMIGTSDFRVRRRTGWEHQPDTPFLQ